MAIKKFWTFLKQWTLPIAIVIGAVGHDVLAHLAPLAPWLLATMLLLTFCNISPRDLRFHPLHLFLLVFQLVGSVVIYLLLADWDLVIAQSASLCIITPTATSAAVITGMLGGSIAFLAAYTFISSLAVTMALPMLLSFISPLHAHIPFWDTSLHAFLRVGPTMLVPLLLAWALQHAAPRLHARMLRHTMLAYYLWAAMLVILMAQTFDMLLASDPGDYRREMLLAAMGCVICGVHFVLGKYMGSHCHRRIAAGQALAQKNILLPMWLTFQYLDPLTAISLAAYSVFQNTVNAGQLWLKGRRDARIFHLLHAYHAAKHARPDKTGARRCLLENTELSVDLPADVRKHLPRVSLKRAASGSTPAEEGAVKRPGS